MKKSLVIVESPAKAKTINRILGKSYTVMASMGHVRDLPKSKLGVDIEGGFVPSYVIPTKKKKLITQLKAAAKTAAKIYLAPDPDREGEAIAWHLQEVLKASTAPFYRVAYNEITERAVREAFEKPEAVDFKKVDSQQARRILDRIVGYRLSPLLWDKVARGLSAGRVQSVAVKLICDREVEISNFKPEEYWTIEAELEKKTEA
ncbi:MAG: toprim domain-containing protein, partial [Candidatus Aureabacteria bacterium]|nr:toprim domain-containing protein [Candidatus Auribacterota bacterium]